MVQPTATAGAVLAVTQRLRWSHRRFAALWDAAKAREQVAGRRLKAQALAVPCNVHPDTVYNWRRGRGQPNADQLLQLSDVLDCEIIDFYE